MVFRLYECISVPVTRHIELPRISPTFSFVVITIKYGPEKINQTHAGLLIRMYN